jgi:hypothetical protein
LPENAQAAGSQTQPQSNLTRTVRGAGGKQAPQVDVLHLWHIEQTECFMVLLKWLIDGPSSISIRRRTQKP